MLYEFLFARDYIFSKKRLCTIMGFTSIVVTSLTVATTILFLSVTDHLETTWLKKLTKLNAPLKIVDPHKKQNTLDLINKIKDLPIKGLFCQEYKTTGSLISLTTENNRTITVPTYISSFNELSKNFISTLTTTPTEEIEKVWHKSNLSENLILKKIELLKMPEDISRNNDVEYKKEFFPQKDHEQYTEGYFYLDNKKISAVVPKKYLSIVECEIVKDFEKSPSVTPPWIYSVKGIYQLPKCGIWLPQHYQNKGVTLGNKAVFSDLNNRSQNFHVSGFYDPGIFTTPTVFTTMESLLHISEICGSSPSDYLMCDGIGVWFTDIQNKKNITLIKEKLSGLGLKIVPFWDYPFAKEIISDFARERYIFWIIISLVTVVAISNILSFLVILVHKKHYEIGILTMLGAKKHSIIFIFTTCGVVIGLLGLMFGISIAFLLLHNLEAIVHLLDIHEEIFTTDYPNRIEPYTLLYVSVATLLTSIVSAILPAINASKIKPLRMIRRD